MIDSMAIGAMASSPDVPAPGLLMAMPSKPTQPAGTSKVTRATPPGVREPSPLVVQSSSSRSMWYLPGASGPDPTGRDRGLGLGLGLGVAIPPTFGCAERGKQVEADDADDHDGRRRHHDLEGLRSCGGTSAPATMAALWGRGELVEHRVQDAVREIGDPVLQPRPDDAGGVAFGVHWAASHATGWASASSAARSPRIA